MDRETMLSKIREEIRALYGDRLQGVVLYGSTARGEDREDSDIDILVLLAPPLDYARELGRLVRALYPLSFEVGREISPKPALLSDLEEAEFPLYREVNREGILI